jgi:DNA-binding NtrC family response regulator
VAVSLLIVDDEVDIRDCVEDFLLPYGFEVFQAGSADEAMLILASQSITVLVSDVVMPGMNGIDLADAAVALQPELGVLLISGYVGNPELMQNTHRFLAKPFRMDKLLSAIGELAKKKAGDHKGSPAKV